MLFVQVIVLVVNVNQRIAGQVCIVKKLIVDIILLVKNVMTNVLVDVQIKQPQVVQHVEIMSIKEFVLRNVQMGSKYFHQNL